MRIWVDADACPVVIKTILFRAAERARILVTLVANSPLRVPPSNFIETLLVPGGMDVADERIVELVTAGDLVITADIPLAAAVLEAGGHALNPRGERYDADNIQQKLRTRAYMEELRGSGVFGGGPPPLTNADRKTFADQLDRILSRHSRSGN